MHRPKFQIIEHLKDLDVVNEKDADSDKQYVIAMMNEINYWIQAFQVDAYDFSSKTVRVRYLFGCVAEERRSKTRHAYMASILRTISLPSHSSKEFLMDDLEKIRHAKRTKTTHEAIRRAAGPPPAGAGSSTTG